MIDRRRKYTFTEESINPWDWNSPKITKLIYYWGLTYSLCDCTAKQKGKKRKRLYSDQVFVWNYLSCQVQLWVQRVISNWPRRNKIRLGKQINCHRQRLRRNSNLESLMTLTMKNTMEHTLTRGKTLNLNKYRRITVKTKMTMKLV